MNLSILISLPPNLFFDPPTGAFKRTTKGYYSPGYSLTG